MNTYTFTAIQLKNLIAFTLERFAASDSAFDFSGGAQAETVEAILAMVESNGLCPDCGKPTVKLDHLTTCTHCQRTWLDDAKRLENSLPLVDEGFDIFDGDQPPYLDIDLVEIPQSPVDDIPFDGSTPANINDAKRLENSLPLVDEDEEWALSMHGYGIPFQGEPTPYDDDDNTSPTAIGLEPVA